MCFRPRNNFRKRLTLPIRVIARARKPLDMSVSIQKELHLSATANAEGDDVMVDGNRPDNR